MDFVFDRSEIKNNDLALYRATAGSAPLRVLSFLYLGPDPDHGGCWASPPERLSLKESWKARGVYFFSTDYQGADLTALRSALLTSGQNDNRGVAWVTDPGGAEPVASVVPMTWTGESTGRVSTDTNIPFLNVSLRFQRGVMSQLDFDNPCLKFIVGDSGEADIYLSRGTIVGPQPEKPNVAIELSPSAASLGQLHLTFKWRAQDFFALFRDDAFGKGPAWGGEIRYFVQCGDDARPRQLVYPIFPAPGPTVNFPMAVTLDPLAPTDAQRTSFVLDTDDRKTLATFDSTFARTTRGKVIRLVAEPGVAFYIGRRLSSSAGADAEAYLATMGTFQIDLGQAVSARMMCGFTTQEYITVTNGDRIEFLPGQPAFGDLQDKDKGLRALANSGEAPVFQDRFTTSWAAIRPGRARTEGGSGADYFSQPQNGTYFDRKALNGTTYSAATTARIAPADLSPLPFPMPLYGGIYPPDNSTEGWPNADVEAALFNAVEGALAPVRFDIMAKAAEGTGPTMCTLAGQPLAGRRSATRNGALLELGSSLAGAADGAATPEGGWARLVLGESNKGQIAFGKTATGQVNPALAHALLNPQTFLVLNDWAKFQEFEGFTSVQGIDVNLAPVKGTCDPRQTIMVFKYANTETLANLIDRLDAWESPSVFVGDKDKVADARETLRAAIANAKAQANVPGKPFQHFLEDILNVPEWTGFLVFNAPIDGRQMSPDYQMVLGGIGEQLHAHHFGVETNRLKVTGDEPEIQCTSFTGVFFHLEPDRECEAGVPQISHDQDYAFRTTKLIIEIRNSTIQQFSSQVAVTLNQLFDRPVQGNAISEKDGPNTLRLDGDYQVVNGVGRVVFDTALDRSFGFRVNPADIRVLEQFGLRGAGLSPISSGTQPEDSETAKVSARLSLDGELAFVEAPFPAAPGHEPLDIFSYGVKEEDGQLRGLPVSGLSLDLEFCLGPNGQEGDIRITPSFADVVATDNALRRRPTGLVSGLPMRLTGLLSGAAALDAVERTGKVLNVPDFVALSDPASGDDLNQVTVMNATTPTPSFALAFELPLGSVGDLADTGVGLTCNLVLGWGPSAAMPEADGAALYVQLPALVGGLAGFNLQGFLKTTFGDANLARVLYKPPDDGPERGVYVLLFNNVAISIFGIPLPPKVVTDFILFSDPDASGRVGTNDIAWSLAATQVSDS